MFVRIRPVKALDQGEEPPASGDGSGDGSSPLEVIGEIEGSALKLRCRLLCDLLGVANSAAFTYLDGDSDTSANRNPNARRKCTTVLNWGSLFELNER